MKRGLRQKNQPSRDTIYSLASCRCQEEGVTSLLVENSEVGISARQTRQRNVEDLAVSQLGYLATDQATALAQVDL